MSCEMAKRPLLRRKRSKGCGGLWVTQQRVTRSWVSCMEGSSAGKCCDALPRQSGPGSPAGLPSLGVSINCSKNSLQSNSWHIKPQLSAHIFTYFIKLPFGCFWSSKTAKGKKVSDTFFVFLRCENVVFKRCFSSTEHMTRVERKKGSIKIWKLASPHT